MSIVSLEQKMRTPAIDAAMKTVERKSQHPEIFPEEVIADARDIGKRLGKKFIDFAQGTRKEFSGYLMTSHELHAAMDQGFWEVVEDNFDNVTLHSDHEQDGISIFEMGNVALLARTDFSEDGVPAGVNYEAALIPDVEPVMLGRIAALYAMQ